MFLKLQGNTVLNPFDLAKSGLAPTTVKEQGKYLELSTVWTQSEGQVKLKPKLKERLVTRRGVTVKLGNTFTFAVAINHKLSKLAEYPFGIAMLEGEELSAFLETIELSYSSKKKVQHKDDWFCRIYVIAT